MDSAHNAVVRVTDILVILWISSLLDQLATDWQSRRPKVSAEVTLIPLQNVCPGSWQLPSNSPAARCGTDFQSRQSSHTHGESSRSRSDQKRRLARTPICRGSAGVTFVVKSVRSKLPLVKSVKRAAAS